MAKFSKPWIALSASFALMASGLASANEVETLSWAELMPPGQTAPFPMVGHSAADPFDFLPPAQPGTFETNPAVLNKSVRIEGFAVPLDMVDGRVARFLLVPYFGACIHMPPPPPNQIIDVRPSEPIEINGLDTIVTVSGEVVSERSDTEFGNAAYVIFDASISFED